MVLDVISESVQAAGFASGVVLAAKIEARRKVKIRSLIGLFIAMEKEEVTDC